MDIKDILEAEQEINAEYERQIALKESSILLAQKEKRSIKNIEKSIKELGEKRKKDLEEFARSKEILGKREKALKDYEEAQKDIKAREEQKIRGEEEEWDKRRAAAQEAFYDPAGFMKVFLLKKAQEKVAYLISAKRRREVAEEKDKEMAAEKKAAEELIEKRKELNLLKKKIVSPEVVPSTSPLVTPGDGGSDESNNKGSDLLIEAIESSGLNTADAIEGLTRQQNVQWKADQRVSASEEAAAANGPSGSSITSPGTSPEIGMTEAPKPGIMEKMKSPTSGLKGIIGNVMKKFGKAGKFLSSLGAKFLMPFITTPIGWAALAGLAVGGLVFAYWDDITAFVGKMFDGVKSMFSKVVGAISGMFSAVGNAIKEVISFFNPMNLLPMIARALLPTDMYDAVSSFFGGDSTEEREDRGKQEAAKKELQAAEYDVEEANYELDAATDVQQRASGDLSDLEGATAVAIYPDGRTSIVTDKINGRHNVPGAEDNIRKNGARVATKEEVKSLIVSAQDKLAVADMKVEDALIKSTKADNNFAAAAGKFNEIDKLVKGSDQKKKKPGNIVADLVRAGAVDYNVIGNSVVKDWQALKKLDYGTLEKVLSFDDWSDDTGRGILRIMNSKKQLIGANDVNPNASLEDPRPVLARSENGITKKNNMISAAMEKGLDNKIRGSESEPKTSAQNNLVTSSVVNNNTTIKKENTHDTDITNRSLNKSAMMFSEQDF